jgi:hypothetical protein
VKTRLAGGWYSDTTRRIHFFRIAASCVADCIYWAQKFTNHPDIQSILEDERTEIIDDAGGSSDSDSSTSSESSASDAALRLPAKKRKRK